MLHSMPFSHNYENSGRRTIHRWYLDETLGKGGFSWVKLGIDIFSGFKVALKCIPLSKEKYSKKDCLNNGLHFDEPIIIDNRLKLLKKQIKNEINASLNIQHSNIVRLWGYCWNTMYPNKDGTVRQIALLIFEYLPNGSLLDYIYYRNVMNESLAQKYFRQMIDGLEICHNYGIMHSDIKLNNLLLDSNFNVKICDFGLCKSIKKLNKLNKLNIKIKQKQVSSLITDGTTGYQSPESLIYCIYSYKCDIFALGVVLFALLIGRMPFYNATKNDPFYKYIIESDYKQFWEIHLNSDNYDKNRENNDKLHLSNEAIDLINKMLEFDPLKRISIKDIKKHPWYIQEPLSNKIINNNKQITKDFDDSIEAKKQSP